VFIWIKYLLPIEFHVRHLKIRKYDDYYGNASHRSSDARLPRRTATWPISQPRKIWMRTHLHNMNLISFTHRRPLIFTCSHE
jgi:hypothetical protein